MANVRGYVDIVLDKPRRLLFDFNAVCKLEDVLGKPVTKLHGDNIGFKEIRAMLYVGLLHEDKNMTLEKAGELIGHAESIQYVTEKTAEAFAKGLGLKPQNETGEGPGESGNQNGTGTNSDYSLMVH